MQVEKKRIAFIFIEEIHHLYHFISIAIELSKYENVHILTFPHQDHLLEQTLENLGGHKVKVERRSTKLFRAITDKLKKRKFPRAGFWMQNNQKYILKNFDAVVFTDYNHHKLLKAKNKLASGIKFIKLPHGIAGRKYVYKKDLLDFDFHLIFGQFYANELKKRKLLTAHKVIGYPKLETVKKLNKQPVFENTKPTVIYNPHFTTPFSSWHKFGQEILDYFYHQNQYNLIFAPHINLFNKRGGSDKSSIPEKFYNAQHIHIDLGSIDSVNMRYTLNADIYLGDVSSQVFEFILQPRPVIFINANQVDYQNDIGYRLWQTGNVISELSNFEEVLQNSQKNFKNFKPIQKIINTENIYQNDKFSPSERGSKAIIEFLAED